MTDREWANLVNYGSRLVVPVDERHQLQRPEDSMSEPLSSPTARVLNVLAMHLDGADLTAASRAVDEYIEHAEDNGRGRITLASYVESALRDIGSTKGLAAEVRETMDRHQDSFVRLAPANGLF